MSVTLAVAVISGIIGITALVKAVSLARAYNESMTNLEAWAASVDKHILREGIKDLLSGGDPSVLFEKATTPDKEDLN